MLPTQLGLGLPIATNGLIGLVPALRFRGSTASCHVGTISYMNALPSTEFRKRFARLTEPTLVTVNGHPIGTWMPGPGSWEEVIAPGVVLPLKSSQSPQAKRDELLRKINRKS